jgi:hypothetical protein
VSGLSPSSGVLNTRRHNVTETGSASVLRWGEGSGVLNTRRHNVTETGSACPQVRWGKRDTYCVRSPWTALIT